MVTGFPALILALSFIFLNSPSAAVSPPPVELARVPDSGIQPQAIVGVDGTIHLLYYKGDAAAGDLFYVKRAAADAVWSKPIRVNSQPGAAVAMGNIRGGQMALGRNGIVHVAWNGSSKVPPGPQKSEPMLYARLPASASAFEAQKSLMTAGTSLDGGGSVAADSSGNVYVVWHAMPIDAKVKNETSRRVYVAASTDDGLTFAAETPRSTETNGACGCCGLKSAALLDGTLLTLYRAAGEKVNRDMRLMRSTDSGKTFADSRLDEWNLGTCPMSSASILPLPSGFALAWETRQEIRWTLVPSAKAAPGTIHTLGDKSEGAKFPSIAADSSGNLLIAWTQGMGWNKGGRLKWQLFDAKGKALDPTDPATSGGTEGVPTWSLVAAVAKPGGGFLVLY